MTSQKTPPLTPDEIAEIESDIEISRREFAEGKGIPSNVVFENLHKMLMEMEAKRRP